MMPKAPSLACFTLRAREGDARLRFTGICLVTENVPALTEFYTKVLGVEAEGDDVHAEFKTEGAGISIFSVEGMESMAPRSMRGAGYGSIPIMFRVDDVDAEYERLRTLGVEFVMLPTSHPWGSRSFWFRDPDGNIVDFYGRATK
jgi:catechol 2,3-dioxygenase-like lactoylglutathione lyase family enzyme